MSPPKVPYERHGGSGTRLYRIFHGMRSRCYNELGEDYIHYGGRGITVDDCFSTFTKFRVWALANGYSELLTLDREDNSGNYSTSNCRWVTRLVQAQNTRLLRKDSPTLFRGVSKNANGQTFSAHISIVGKTKHLGSYPTVELAAHAYDNFIKTHSGYAQPLNFPLLAGTINEEAKTIQNSDVRLDNTSGFTGVTVNKTNGRIKVGINHMRKSINLGWYDNIEIAANVYDNFIKLNGLPHSLNFKGNPSINEEALRLYTEFKGRKPSSPYHGVFYHSALGKFIGYVRINKKVVHIHKSVIELEVAEKRGEYIIASNLQSKRNFSNLEGANKHV